MTTTVVVSACFSRKPFSDINRLWISAGIFPSDRRRLAGISGQTICPVGIRLISGLGHIVQFSLAIQVR